MDREQYSTRREKGKHLNYEKRIKIEALSKAGIKSEEIGRQIGSSGRTIRRELKKGKVKVLNSDLTERWEYSADVGEQKHEYAGTGKGPALKIGKEYELVGEIERLIIDEKMSPYAAAETIKADERFKVKISYKTIYNYIDEDIFPNLTNKHLPVKKNKKREHKKVRTAENKKKGVSISEREESVESREEYGHWEMDTVVGKAKTKTVLMVLTERMTRQEIIRKIKSKSQYCIVKELDKLERKMGSQEFRERFKTITCDNGCENLDYEGIERSVLSKGAARTKVYYAHPYSAWERGSNENANKLIRRFIPKGADIAGFSHERIQMIERWINNYPRRIFHGLSSNMFLTQLPIA